jgi:hypothetical protein
MARQAPRVASGGRKLGERARQRCTEAWQVRDARELRAIDAPRGRFDD